MNEGKEGKTVYSSPSAENGADAAIPSSPPSLSSWNQATTFHRRHRQMRTHSILKNSLMFFQQQLRLHRVFGVPTSVSAAAVLTEIHAMGKVRCGWCAVRCGCCCVLDDTFSLVWRPKCPISLRTFLTESLQNHLYHWVFRFRKMVYVLVLLSSADGDELVSHSRAADSRHDHVVVD